jgi:hypothetical protein
MPRGAEIFIGEETRIIGEPDVSGGVIRQQTRMIIGGVDRNGKICDEKISLAGRWINSWVPASARKLTQPDTGAPLTLEDMRLAADKPDEVKVLFMQVHGGVVAIGINLHLDTGVIPEIFVQTTGKDTPDKHAANLRQSPEFISSELDKLGILPDQRTILMQALGELYRANGMEHHARKCDDYVTRDLFSIEVHGGQRGISRGR